MCSVFYTIGNWYSSISVSSTHFIIFYIFYKVFHSLLKAHAVEARSVVRQALEILTPAMPGRMEDGNVSTFTIQT
jgi:hypothetical protein